MLCLVGSAARRLLIKNCQDEPVRLQHEVADFVCLVGSAHPTTTTIGNCGAEKEYISTRDRLQLRMKIPVSF
ncbi:hypothetical protein [Scytonema sp. NUACC21]